MTKNGAFDFIDCLSTQSEPDTGDSLTEAEKGILQSIQKHHKSPDRHVVLILDNPDILLGSGITTAQHLDQLVQKLRSLVHSVVVTCSVDLPLVTATAQSTNATFSPLEVDCARFITRQAHNANFVMSVRGLDTGAARDVSGVLRVTRSGHSYDLDDDEEASVREMEALYLVQKDGGVQSFRERDGFIVSKGILIRPF